MGNILLDCHIDECLKFVRYKMKRCHKGILGVRKDPKNQILFSFSAREGEEWPSDDSDSDFLPSDEEDINPTRFVNFHIYMYI